ncbi:hypothetical protein Bhyg_08717, partial [Pseudolycoriella hygida]
MSSTALLKAFATLTKMVRKFLMLAVNGKTIAATAWLTSTITYSKPNARLITSIEKLESRSSQMRLIVRSMFIKLEDQRENALDGIMMLYKTTQTQINDVLKELDDANCKLQRCRHNLSCAIAMCRIIIENLDLPQKVTEGLCSVLVSPVMDWLINTWEETTNDSLDRLNHIGALRKNKNATIEEHTSYATTSMDVSKYKRRLSTLLERVCRMSSKKDNKQDDNNLADNDWLEEENE